MLRELLRQTLLSLCFTAVAATAQEPLTNPHTSSADVAAGAKTFRSHCSPCHGMNGEGGRGPNLASGHFYHGSSDAGLLGNISNGIAGTEMPGLFYSPDRVWQIVAYIRSLHAGSDAAAPGDRTRGAQLFREKGCVNCHRIGGEGGRMGPDLTYIGEIRSAANLRQSIVDPGAVVVERYWVVSFRDASGQRYEGFLMNEDSYTVQCIDMKGQLHSFEKASLQDYKVDKTSKMPSYKDSLSEAQVQDLVAYLTSLGSRGGTQ